MARIHKLSCGPNTFVGIADVKLHPNSSLYALKCVEGRDQADTAHILCIDSLILNIDQSLCIRVSKITLVRRAAVYLGLIEWIRNLVGKDARR